MIVCFTTITGRELAMACSVAQFLAGPVASRLAAVRDSADAREVVSRYLPANLESRSSDEILRLVENACLCATWHERAGTDELVDFRDVTEVRMSMTDLGEAIRHFGAFSLVNEEPNSAA